MKKILAILLAMTMLFSLAACSSSSSEDEGEVSTSPTDITPVETETPVYDPEPVESITICGIPVVVDYKSTGISYKGITYSDGVLTIDSVSMVSDISNYACIEYSGDLTIVLVGESTMTISNQADAAILGNTVEVEGETVTSSLTIMGDGSLDVSVTSESAYGILCEGGIIHQSGNVSVSATAGAVLDIDAVVIADGYEMTVDSEFSFSIA